MKRFTAAILIICTLPIILSVSSHGRSAANPGVIQTPQMARLTDSGGAYWPSWSPRGDRIAYFEKVDSYVTEFGTDRQEPVCNLRVMDSDGSDKSTLWEGEIRGYIGWPIYPTSWSHDGRYIAVDTRLFRTNLIIDCTDGSNVTGTVFPTDCAAPRFAPSSPHLAFARYVVDHDVDPIVEDRSIHILNYETGEERLLREGVFNSETEWQECPSVWSWDGQMLRVTDNRQTENTYHFYSATTGELFFASDDPRGGTDFSALFPDRTRSNSRRLKVISPAVPDPELSSLNHGGAGTGLKVCWIDEDGSETVIFNIDAHIYSFQWHPRGDILLFSAGQRSESPDQAGSSNVYIVAFPK